MKTEEGPKESELLTAALKYMQNADGAAKNACGHVRASAVRDKLMSIPEFRIALKESGLKPIPFIQQLFTGNIRLYREKGIYWVTADNDSETTEDKNALPPGLLFSYTLVQEQKPALKNCYC